MMRFDPTQQIERGMQLAKECCGKHANAAHWLALRAHLERMTHTIPGGSWDDLAIVPSTEPVAEPAQAPKASPAVSGAEPSERERFEAWAVSFHGSKTLSDPDAGSMWSAWQAARSIPSGAEPALSKHDKHLIELGYAKLFPESERPSGAEPGISDLTPHTADEFTADQMRAYALLAASSRKEPPK